MFSYVTTLAVTSAGYFVDKYDSKEIVDLRLLYLNEITKTTMIFKVTVAIV
jgi:hypothetical protein